MDVAHENDGHMLYETCGDFEIYTLARFIFLTFTSLIALLGSVGNVVLVYIFSSRSSSNTPPTLYPTVLAILDSLLCALYLMLFGVDAAVVYLHVESLFVLYHIYIVPAFVASRITQLAIPYMLIFGTLERFVWISGSRNAILSKMYSVRGRHITMCITLLFCIGLRLPTAFATVVNQYPNCTDFFRSKSTGPAEWAVDSEAYYFFDFHLLSIAQTFIPFFVLVTFNLVIVRRLTKERSRNEDKAVEKSSVEKSSVDDIPQNPFQRGFSIVPIAGLPMPFRRMSGPVRNAIYAMMAIVTTYLISNSLHLILTVMERSKSSLLRDPADPNLASNFHTVFSDTVSFVYMFTSAIRLIIYCICDPTTRNDVKHIVSPPPPHDDKLASLPVPL